MCIAALTTSARRATERFEAARETGRRFLNAAHVSEIVFVRGATEGIDLVAQGRGGAFLKAGDQAILTELEHHSNIVPWQLWRERTGIEIAVVPIDQSGALDIEAYKRLLGPKTKLVAITQVANVTGHVVDDGELGAAMPPCSRPAPRC